MIKASQARIDAKANAVRIDGQLQLYVTACVNRHLELIEKVIMSQIANGELKAVFLVKFIDDVKTKFPSTNRTEGVAEFEEIMTQLVSALHEDGYQVTTAYRDRLLCDLHIYWSEP